MVWPDGSDVKRKLPIVSLSRSISFSDSLGALFWVYSGNSYSGLGITEYTEFQFPRERSFWKRNTHGGGDLRTTTSAHALVCPETKMAELGGRVGFPAQNFPKRTGILHIPSIKAVFHSFCPFCYREQNERISEKRNSSQRNKNTIYSK